MDLFEFAAQNTPSQQSPLERYKELCAVINHMVDDSTELLIALKRRLLGRSILSRKFKEVHKP